MKKVFWKFGFTILGLAGILTACPAPTPQVLTTIAIAGAPSDNNLKISQATQLTATAKDANGNDIAGVVFSWSSSNPDAVGVNSSGLVTATKWGTAVISASASGISGSTPTQTTYGLEAVFGTRTYKSANETNRMFRFRFKVGQTGLANTGLNFVTTGPTGWNNNQTTITNVSFGSTPINSTQSFISHSPIPVISGNYKLSVLTESESFESAVSTVDATAKLTPTTITIDSASATSVSASWTPVTGSISSYASARNCSDNTSNVQTNVLTNSTTTATLTGLSLVANKSPCFTVFAYNFDIGPRNNPTYIFPTQANGAVEDKVIALP